MNYDIQTSSAMNYYEELGVPQDATEQEIRKAHRRLVKLMHPDAQPDQNLKMLAETQMRRLNSIVSTLLDPEQRHAYDDQLNAAAAAPPARAAGVFGFSAVPWWITSAIGAVILSLGAIWLWADHMGAGNGRARVAPYSHEGDRTSPMQSPEVSYRPSDVDSRMGDASAMDSRRDPNQRSSQAESDPNSEMPTSGGMSTAVVADTKPQAKSEAKKQSTSASFPPVEKARPNGSMAEPNRIETAKPIAEDRQGSTGIKGAFPGDQRSASSDESTANGRRSENGAESKPILVASNSPTKSMPPAIAPTIPRKAFSLPAGTIVARAGGNSGKSGGTQLPPPPIDNAAPSREYGSSPLPASNLPAATPPKLAVVTTSGGLGSARSRDPLEGEWIYAPTEPEKRKAGFYPPEFIDLKLFLAGDPGNLHGQYSAKYLVTDRPVSSEVSFELASVSKGSRRFVWQSNTGAKGTLNIDPINERTIRVDWRTTSAVRGPALTSGTATLVKRQ